MKKLILLALSAVACSAHASFDLVMVVDAGDKLVKRFDGGTGTYFGSFGQNVLFNPKGMALDRVNPGQILIGDDVPQANFSAVHRFNYNTGEFLGSYSVNMDIVGIGADDRYAFFAGTNAGAGLARAFDLTTKTLGGSIATGVPFETYGANLGAHYMVTSIPATNQVGYWTYDGTAFTSAGSFSATSPRGDFVSADGGVHNVQGNGFRRNDYAVFAAPSLSSAFDMDQGHLCYYLSGQSSDNAAKGRVAIFNTTSQVYTGFLGEGQLKMPTNIAIVMAPEPGTMIALGGAALGLLARRRRRKA